MRRSIVALLVSASASGCSIPLQEPELLVVNSCESSSDCAAGAACATVGDGRHCVATKADLSGLVLEVRPAATDLGSEKQATIKGGVSYLVDPAAEGISLTGGQASGFAVSYNPRLPKLAEISEGRVLLGDAAINDAVPDACPQFGGTLLADVTFRRVPPFAGLPVAEYSTTTDALPHGDGYAYVFSVALPPDTYDIYVSPHTPPECVDDTSDPIPSAPPYFIARQVISGGTMLNITMPTLQKLTGKLKAPASLDITGWTLALVEPASGLEISTIQSLVPPDALDYTLIDIDYSWSFPESGGRPIARLHAPDPSLTAVHWPLVTADVNGDNDVELQMFALDTKPVAVDAVVLDEAEKQTAASVSIEAVGKDTTDAKNVSIKVIVETDPDGRFKTDLFPASADQAATYRVSARPKTDDVTAIGETDWSIKAMAGCFCGQSVALTAKTQLHADVAAPTGEPMRQTLTSADPSVREGSAYFQDQLFEPTLSPRNAVATIEAGQLAMSLDPGTFDLSIRPETESGYPWMVRPHVEIMAGDDVSQLGSLEVSYPVVLQGTLLDADGKPVSDAVIRAWLPIVDSKGEKSTVIQIAEIVTAADGTYVLLLPPSVTQ